MNNTPNFYIIIPARFNSERLPGKPLLPVAGKPLIQHVYERALQCGAKDIFIATDHPKIKQCAKKFSANVVMTSDTHRNGSERLAEAVSILGFSDDDIVVNLQGDEPLMPVPVVLRAVQALEKYPHANVSTFACAIRDSHEFLDPNVVKVVLDVNQCALYFSRAPMPWDRSKFADIKTLVNLDGPYLRHLGVYAYRVATLKRLQNYPMPAIEALEQLEQLRLLYHGEKIVVECIDTPLPPGVDTQEDLQKVEEKILGMQ